MPKNSTFSGLGLRAGQVGRQKMPVVFTPAKKTPSKVESRSRNAFCMVLTGGSVSMMEV